MNKVFDISREDEELMVRYNIKTETRTVFYSGGYKYDNLQDAIRYAKQSEERERASADH